MTSAEQDAAMLRRALRLAARGNPADPNPRVGAVLTSPDGEVIAQAWHAGSGTPHAEAIALAEAGERALGATAYSTLEPCDHLGRTGPCSQALITAGVARVVYGQSDPNPRAAGGARTLAAHGIEVIGGVLAEEAAALNQAWAFAVGTGRPFVTWKFAATLDGRSAAADGTSRWITGHAARHDVHARRARCGAVLVGTGTALADDPHLTVRDADGRPAARQPLRVVMGHRTLPEHAHLLDGQAPTLRLDTHDPHEALAALHERGVRHVWLEGGPTLAAVFLRAGLVDEVVAYLAPALLGAGPSAVADLGVATIRDRLRFTPIDVATVGIDVRLVLRPTTQEEP